VQGQHGRYGPNAGVQQMSPSPQMGPQSFPNGSRQMSPSPQNGPQAMPPHFPNGPQSFPNGPQSMPQGPASFAGKGPGAGPLPGGPGMGNGPQMFAPSQANYPAAPTGSGAKPFAGPSSFAAGGPGYNSFSQGGAGTAFAPNSLGMLAAPPAPLPGTFNRERSFNGTGALADGSRGSREIRRDGPPRDPREGKRKKRRRVPMWARVVIGILLFFIITGTGGFIYYQANFGSSVSSIVGQQVARAKNEGNPNSNLTNGILTGPRVNILLLGSDTDQKFQGSYIAQTDIVVTIDPSSKTVGMLSIPRDFFINVPGYGMHKLDEAYGLGGVALSRETIEQDFGIPINYYAWVGLDGFIKVIDEVGGVDVDVQHPIVDDNYPDDVGKMANDPYAVKRLYLSPGPQHLDGPTALEYVRSRHADLVGDFGRSARQQQVLSALKTKLANPDIFNKLSAIANDLKGYLKTDMQLPDVLKLMNFARSLDPNKIDKLTLGPPYSSGGTAPAGGNDAGADIVIPNCAQIIPAIQKMLQLGNNAACNITGDNGAPTTLPLAYTTGKISSLAYAPSNAGDLSGLFSLFSASASGSTGKPADLFGVQGLLDLLLMGVFESPDVF
jgi:LCP family protein required for cell wall assembly